MTSRFVRVSNKPCLGSFEIMDYLAPFVMGKLRLKLEKPACAYANGGLPS